MLQYYGILQYITIYSSILMYIMMCQVLVPQRGLPNHVAGDGCGLAAGRGL